MQHLHVGAQVADQAARARRRALAPRQGASPSGCCGRSKGRPGATATGRGCRCATSSKKGTVLVGFHERKSSYVADMRQLRRAAAARERAAAAAARADRRRWTQRDRLPQIELAVGDERHRAGAAPPRAAVERATCERLRDFARDARRAMVAAAEGPRHGASARRRRRRRSPTRCPSSASRCRSSRPTSPRSTRTSTGCWSSRALRLLDAAARRARDRLVLRPRQLHAAAGDAGARGARHRGQRGAGRARSRENARAQRAGRARRASRRATCSR